MKMNLVKGAGEWASRPADERFWNLAEMKSAVKKYKYNARVANIPLGSLRVEADADDIKLIGKHNIPARLTNWSFHQLSQMVGAPAGYLQTLPTTLASQNINYGLKTKNLPTDRQLLFHQNGQTTLRAITSNRYTRIWNEDIIERLSHLNGDWKVPPAHPAGVKNERTRIATQADVLQNNMPGLSINVGDRIAPAGLYASDHDMFVFMVNESNLIDDGSEGGLGKGFFDWNSEVGASTFGICSFLYRYVCGNHIVWDASNVSEFRIRHIGDADDRAFSQIQIKLRKYADSSVSDIEAKIAKAKTYQIASTKDDVLDALFKTKLAPRKVFRDAYSLTEQNTDTDGSPYTPWGIAQGLTRLSQSIPHTDRRNKIDRVAGEVLEMAF